MSSKEEVLVEGVDEEDLLTVNELQMFSTAEEAERYKVKYKDDPFVSRSVVKQAHVTVMIYDAPTNS